MSPKRITTLEEVAAELAWQRAEIVALKETLANTPRLHQKDVLARYGISRTTLHRWRQNGFPDPARFSGGRFTGGPLWRIADLEKAEAAGRLPRPVSA